MEKLSCFCHLSVGYAFTLGDVLTFNDENMPILNYIQLVYYSAISFFVFGFAGLFFSTKAGISEKGLKINIIGKHCLPLFLLYIFKKIILTRECAVKIILGFLMVYRQDKVSVQYE